MPWLKQNLSLVIGGFVALVLLSLAGLWTKQQYDADRDVDAALASKRSEVKSLFERKTSPTQENIASVQKEQELVSAQLLEPLRTKFTGYPTPESMTLSDFKEILENQVSYLNRKARFTGIQLPSVDEGTYGFSFDDIRPKIDLEDGSLKPLTFQLLQIREICEVLYDANIYGVNAIMRLPVSENDIPGSGAGDLMGSMGATASSSSATSNYIEGETVTDQDLGVIMYPYQISFECGSAELSHVLVGFNQADHFFHVKWLSVEETGTTTSGGMLGLGKSLEARYGLAGGGMGADPYAGMANRYGGGAASPFGGGVGAQPSGMLDQLEEHVLTVNMSLVAIASGYADLEAVKASLQQQINAASEDDKYVFEQELEAIESDPDGKLQDMRLSQLEAVAPMPVEDDGSSDSGTYPYN